MTRSTATADLLTRRAPREASSYNAETRRFKARLSSFAPVRRGFWIERLSPEPADWDLSRLRTGAGVPFVDSHNLSTMSARLGRVIDIQVRGDGVDAVIELNESPGARALEAELLAASPIGISFGYSAHYDRYAGQDGQPETRLARNIQIHEVSAVIVPADAQAFARGLHTTRTANMDPEDLDDLEDLDVERDHDHQDPPPRRSARRSAPAPQEPEPPRRFGPADRMEMIHCVVGEGAEADAFYERHRRSSRSTLAEALLEHRRRVSRATPTFSTTVTTLRDEGETLRQGIVEGLNLQLRRAAGERIETVTGPGQRWAGASIVEMAAEAIGWRGHLRTPAAALQCLTRAFHTTSDFPAIFTDALNVRLLARYQAAAPTYRRISTPVMASDFRDHPAIRAGDFPALKPVNEAGEIKGGTFSESKESYRVDAYAVRFQISRQMLVNDQLGAIDQVLGSSGQRVANWENDHFYAMLNQAGGGGFGPVLKTDDRRVFHADHGNLLDAAAINVHSVGAARAAMAKQTTLDGIKANFAPRVLLCSPDLITTAEQLLTQLTPARQADAVPLAIRSLEPVSDANLEGLPWYLFADPAAAPVFVHATLEGFEGPRLTSESTFDVQGVRVKLEHDFGVAAIDFRGGVLNPGADEPTE